MDCTDVEGRLPLHLAVCRQANFAVVRTLLQYHPASIYKADATGKTPLELAITNRAAPGVVFELVRFDKSIVQVRNNDCVALVEMAHDAGAPPWIIEELLEAAPEEFCDTNLLSGKWPNNKSAATALRMTVENMQKERSKGSRAPVEWKKNLQQLTASQPGYKLRTASE